MNFWSDFSTSSQNEWEEKILQDLKGKPLDQLFWKSDVGNINPFVFRSNNATEGKINSDISINCNFDLKKRYNILFSLIDGKNFNDLDCCLLNLKNEANLESNFNKLGINIKKSYSKIITGINMQRLLNNPVKLKKSDVKIILFKN